MPFLNRNSLVPLRRRSRRNALILARLALLAAILATLSESCVAQDATSDKRDTIVLRFEDSSITIVQVPFVRKGAKIKPCEDASFPCEIDGHIPYGAHEGGPKTYIKEIRFSRNGKQFVLPSSAMYDAINEKSKVENIKKLFGVNCSYEICTIRAVLSDASDSFAVQWRVLNGIAVREIITSEPDIVSYVHDNLVVEDEGL